MTSRSLRSGLLAGAALISLTTAAQAQDWSGLVVFGDRWADSGQYPVYSVAVGSASESEVGDGRNRATELASDGGFEKVYTQVFSEEMGFGALLPSQPADIEGAPAIGSGLNYSGLFNDNEDIAASVNGTSYSPGTIIYQRSDGVTVPVATGSGPGFLLGSRADEVDGALVLIAGGMRDIRQLADINTGFANSPTTDVYTGAAALEAVDIWDTDIVLDEYWQTSIAQTSANHIGNSIDALKAAGSGLIVAPNLIDVSMLPEVQGDIENLTSAKNAIETRLEQHRVATQILAETDATVRANLQSQLNGLVLVTSGEVPAASSYVLSDWREDELTEKLAGVDAALADPSLLGQIRSAGTDAYNAQLLERARATGDGVIVVDYNTLLKKVVADPTRYGFSNVDQTNACGYTNSLHECTVDENASVGDLMFVNGIDPTKELHEIFAQYTASLLDAPRSVAAIPHVAIGGARSITQSANDQVTSELLYDKGFAPFATAVIGGTTLDEYYHDDKQDARYYSGLAGLRYSNGTGFGYGAGIGYQNIDTPGTEASIEYDGSAFYGTAFAGLDRGGLIASVTGTYGTVAYDANRIVQLGDAEIDNVGKAKGSVWGARVELGARLYSKGPFSAGPIAHLSHYSSSIDGYREEGEDLTGITVDDLSGKSTRAGLGFFVEAGEMVEGVGIVFRGKGLYGHEFEDRDGTMSVGYNSPNGYGTYTSRVRGADSAPIELGAELVFGIGEGKLVTTLGYDGTFGNSSNHNIRLGASYPLE